MSHMSPNYCHIWHCYITNKGCGLIIILHIVHIINSLCPKFQAVLVVIELWVLEVVDSIKLQSQWKESTFQVHLICQENMSVLDSNCSMKMKI